MGFNCGILGLPNVGKSTLFNALTSTQSAEAQNYPFCTIEPNIGRVNVPDERLIEISKISNSEKTIFNQLEFVDIAGLVKGANKGEGLGNKFLANLNEVDAIVHVVRCFDDKNITHVNSKLDVLSDIKIIETELLLSDLSKIENIINNFINKNKGKKIDENFFILLNKVKKSLENGTLLNEVKFSNDEKKLLSPYNFITLKPYSFVCNVDEDSIISGNEYSNDVKIYSEKKKIDNILVSASIESEISQIDSVKEKNEYLNSIGLSSNSLARLIKNGYSLLNLITFFTSGSKESRAWSCVNGSLAPEAAGKIHTDFEKGFIKAETIGVEDFLKYGGEQSCKEAGKIRQEGKEYLVKDGDIMNFKFNV